MGSKKIVQEIFKYAVWLYKKYIYKTTFQRGSIHV